MNIKCNIFVFSGVFYQEAKISAPFAVPGSAHSIKKSRAKPIISEKINRQYKDYWKDARSCLDAY